MSEIDQIWTKLLDEASLKALESGRSDIADYLRLKLANDTIRRSGVEWLSETMIGLASEAQRKFPSLRIDRISPHAFTSGTSTMVGSMIQMQYGVRCLSIEAGWVRSPSDGIMRNGGLAQARIKHFGMATSDAEYWLVRGHSLPVWIDKAGDEVSTSDLRSHLGLFLGE
jgi:hypothetical protein